MQCTHCTCSLACVPTLFLACCLKVCLEELNSLLQDAFFGASPVSYSSNVGLNLPPADRQLFSIPKHPLCFRNVIHTIEIYTQKRLRTVKTSFYIVEIFSQPVQPE